MRQAKRWAALAVILLLAVALSGCDALTRLLPSDDYDDYDVSAYIQALLDSSYHNSHDRYIVLAQTDQAGAQANNTSTVENAAVHFCNSYNLSPTDEQLAELQNIMAQSLLASQYTVKDERRVDTGYYIEVEVTPVTTLAGLESEFARLRTQAQDEADAANRSAEPEPSSSEEEGEEDEWGDEWGEEEEAEPTPTPEPTPQPEQVDAYELYMDKVVEFCRGRLAQTEYQSQSVTIALDIRQTEQGELQLDMNQIEDIDRTVLVFKLT